MTVTGADYVPGRKVKTPSTQAPIEETEPKRGARPGTKPSAGNSSPRSTRSLETQIGATLSVMNLMLLSVPRIREDALDSTEIIALAKSIDLQCKTSPRFRKYIESALSAGSGAGLLGVCMLIAARRAARHEIIPRDFDGAFGQLLAGTANRQPVEA